MEIVLIQRALIPSSPEPTPLPLSKDVQQLKIAMASPKLSAGTFEDIKGLIKITMLMVGLKASEISAISDVEKQLLVGFIQMQFGGHTNKEFIEAFTMAVCGKLDVNAECYQNFSIAYVSKILAAYRKWASNVYHENFLTMIKPEEETKQLAPPPVDWSDTWNELRKGQIKIIPAVANVYDWAIRQGFIDLSITAKNELCRLASAQLRYDVLQQKLTAGQTSEMQDTYRNHHHPEVINEAKRIAIRNAIKKQNGN